MTAGVLGGLRLLFHGAIDRQTEVVALSKLNRRANKLRSRKVEESALLAGIRGELPEWK